LDKEIAKTLGVTNIIWQRVVCTISWCAKNSNTSAFGWV